MSYPAKYRNYANQLDERFKRITFTFQGINPKTGCYSCCITRSAFCCTLRVALDVMIAYSFAYGWTLPDILSYESY